MKRFLSLLAVAFLLGACNFNFRPTQQRWFLGSKDFHGKNPSMALKISSAEMRGNRVKLFVHVTDTSHFYYQGISPASFCNTFVLDNSRHQYTAQNVKVIEYKKVNREPTAVAFVLDNSGSMGAKKDVLYTLTHKFIDNKREQDAYSIIRYGTFSSLDVNLTKDKNYLKSEFKPQPKKAISGSTSTWDAIVEGVASLENSPFEEKVLIVLTDGGENTSVTTQEWAFWKAKTAGVKVMAISLGKAGEINMKDLCEQTGGMYTFINNIGEVQQAFTDFQNKQSSFYQVEFETPLIGKQTAQVNICDMFLTAQYVFDNSPTDREPIRYKETPPNNPVPTTPVTNTPVTSTGSGRETPTTTNGNTGSNSNGGGRVPTSTSSGSGSGTNTGGGKVPVTTGGTRVPTNTGGSTGKVNTTTTTPSTPKPVTPSRVAPKTPPAQP